MIRGVNSKAASLTLYVIIYILLGPVVFWRMDYPRAFAWAISSLPLITISIIANTFALTVVMRKWIDFGRPFAAFWIHAACLVVGVCAITFILFFLKK